VICDQEVVSTSFWLA